jgi:serine kinase of HPr protein (carbohydrate metabolism regulator)
LAELSPETVHASCVAIGGRAVLVSGRSGSGKSDLTLRLIDRGADLVSDDYTIVTRTDRGLMATAPETIRGKLEIHGVGVVEAPSVDQAEVALLVIVDEPPVRMPSTPETRRLAGVDIPAIALAGLEPSAAIKVEWALRKLAS